MRSVVPFTAGDAGISRFPYELIPEVVKQSETVVI